MTTPLVLVDELVAFLTDVVSEFRLEAPGGVTSAPQVLAGWQPSLVAGMPYVQVRIAGHDDKTPGNSEARVNIYVGTHSESTDGWRDMANVLERIRQALLTRRTMAKKFLLALPMRSTISTEQQPYPDWVGWLETRWIIVQPIEEVIIDGENWS